MIKSIAIILILTCVYAKAYTQVNFVKNPSFENYNKCPDDWNRVFFADGWRNATDSTLKLGIEYYNECGNASLDKVLHIPDNASFYQFPRTGKGMVGSILYNDKSVWAEKGDLPFNYRDNLQGHLIKSLSAGKTYCVSFWINNAEASGYVHNNIGAYLDNGAINLISDTAGEEITSVSPQVYTNTIIEDTMNWVRIEGSFIATGSETYITIGNFVPNAAVSTKYPNYWNAFYTTSYYLIDDVSVIPIDLAADAGKDSHVELGKKVQIGRVGDTTAIGLDCKWYKRGILIDSGATISVNSGASLGVIDTYLVVQTVCGLVKTDTVMVKTVPVGIPLPGEPVPSSRELRGGFSVYPNPSTGVFTLAFRDPSFVGMTAWGSGMTAWGKVYDLLGRVVYQKELSFTNNQAFININAADGFYLLELSDVEGNVSRQRIEVRN